MSVQYRVTFIVERGQEPVVWDETFASGIITARNITMAQAEANALLPNAIGAQRESLEDPEISEDEIKDCRAVVEPLSTWVKRGIESCQRIRGWVPEDEDPFARTPSKKTT